jgi:hypothetical protein
MWARERQHIILDSSQQLDNFIDNVIEKWEWLKNTLTKKI